MYQPRESLSEMLKRRRTDEPMVGKSLPDCQEEKLKVVKSEELLQKIPKPKPYIIDKLVPEKCITAITGESGKGKSLVSLIMAYHIATGEKLFGQFEVKKGKVLIVDLEMDEDIIISRYHSFFDTALDIDFIYDQFWKIDNNKQCKQLKEIIKKQNYQVVILDTLTNIHNANENSSDEMKIVNEAMMQLIRETGVTVIFVHHHRKSYKGERVGSSSSRGSTEIINKTSSHLIVDSMGKSVDENSNYVFSLSIEQSKARRPDSITKIGFNIIYDPEHSKNSWEYIGVIDDGKRVVEAAMEKILKVLEKRQECTIKDFKEEIPEIGGSNLRDAVKILCNKKKVDFYKGRGRQHNTKFYFLHKGKIGSDAQNF